MESVELQPRLPRPLLREPSPTYDTWKNDWPQYLSAYSLAFNAETYATQKAEADSTQNDDITSARVAGYFLLEFLNWRYILTTGPCDQLSKVLLPKSQEPDVVFNVVKWYRDRFIRLCAFHFLQTSFNFSISLELAVTSPNATAAINDLP